MAVAMIPPAAARMSKPSTVLEKYSALPWPYIWLSSGGLAAMINIASATLAPIRFAKDSRASESKPTEPVNAYATNLRIIVRIAAPMDNQAYRLRGFRFFIMFRCSSCLWGITGFRVLLVSFRPLQTQTNLDPGPCGCELQRSSLGCALYPWLRLENRSPSQT